MDPQLKWHLLVLKVVDALTSELFLHVLKLLMKVERYQYAITGQIEGVPKKGKESVISYLYELEEQPLLVEKVLQTLPKLDILEWGDFFLFENYPIDWPGCEAESYPPLIRSSRTTVRAVDHTYIYIYTRSSEAIELIKKR